MQVPIAHISDRQVLNNEEVAIYSACSTGEAEVFQPYDGVGDVRRRAEPHRERGLPDLLRERLRAASVRARTAPCVSDLGVSTVVIRVTVAVVWLIPVCQVRLTAFGTLSRAGVVVSDKAAACRGVLPSARRSVLIRL